MPIKCPNCRKNEAIVVPILGVLKCTACQNATRAGYLTPTTEFTSDTIKEDRKRYAKDILQPFRGGEVSKEYIEKYGTKNLGVTKEEVKKAVTTTDSYYG
jgi:hypothetical protein